MRTDSPNFAPYKIISERVSEDRIYELLEFSLSQTSKVGEESRRKILNEILERKRAVGIIEWWTRGSIIHKSKKEFQAILVSKL